MADQNGSWTPRDPALRRLRILAGTVMLILLTYVVVDGQPDNPATVGTLIGALLVDLGFELGIRWPGGKG
jgi:hypothetical protein